MKIYNYTTLLLLLTCFVSFAQLTVKNDSYLYVDGTGFASTSVSNPDVAPLFVKDDVRIEDTSHIYLRNDAQLLQGDGLTGNSGLGKISVYQSGTTHNWAYNFWASPVGNIDTDVTGNNDFRANNNFYERTDDINSTTVAFTSGLDGTSGPLTISSYWLYAYNPGTQYSDWDHIGSTGDLESGYGFTMKGITGSTGQLYDFRGKPNSGLISIDVLDGQDTLAGNPYPSSIDAAAFIHDLNNINFMDGTLLFWEHDLSVSSHVTTDYIGGYGMYTITSDGLTQSWNAPIFSAPDANAFPSGIGSASTSGKRVYRYITIGQGFMITGTADGSVEFKNEHRAFYKQSESNSEFFKTNNQNETFNNNPTDYEYNEYGQIVEAPYKRFRLNVNFNNAFTRPLLHNFHPDATNDFDYGLESRNTETAPTDAYFILGDMPFVTQAHAFDIDLKIPLVIKVEENMPVAIKVFDVQNFGDQEIYLHDKVTDVYYDLTVLNFETNLETGIYDTRFEITFKDANILSVSEFDDSDFSIFQNNTLAHLVVSNPNSLAIKSIALTDVSGKQIFNKANLGGNTKYEYPTKNLSDGVYIVSVRLDNNEVQNKKIIVANK